MPATSVPCSLSIYRGQADQGIGEPGAGIRRGEQYIAADPALADEPGLLHAVRDWLTLDSTPADHGRADGRLTGWAAFPLGPYSFVVRLVSAGKYAGQDAYFAHARVWQTAALPPDTDPGLYIGLDHCFVESAEVIADATRGPVPMPDPVSMEAVLARKDLAISLTAHLFHGMLSKVPLIVAVPITDFGANSSLPRLVAFARGALPARLRLRCRIRIFSRSPQRLLDPSNGPGGSDLILIPNDDQTVHDSLTAAGRSALLLDEHGERLKGSAPPEELLAYAVNLIDSAQRFPDQLTAFTNRFDTLWPNDGGPPTAAQTERIALTYNLTVALAGSETQRGSLFANYLLAQARSNPNIPWSTLIHPEEWADFPREQLIRFILRADDDRSPGERQLQGVLATVFQQRGETLDDGLSTWWSPNDPDKRRRLLELCQPDPPLVSTAASAALTVPLPIDELAAGGAPITGALRAEHRQGQLGHRQHDADRLLTLLDQPGLLELLDQATRDGTLTTLWKDGDLSRMQDPQVIAVARHLLRTWEGQSVVGRTGLIRHLLTRLRQDPTGLEAIADDLRNVLYRIDIPRNPERYLDLADALLHARPGSADELRARFWETTHGLASVDDPKGLLRKIIEGRWLLLHAGYLLGEDGSLNVDPTAETATALLESPAVAERIRHQDLMTLGNLLPVDAQRAVDAYHARVDALMKSEPKRTTGQLIQSGAWLAWRRHAEPRLSTEQRHRHAMDWLTSPILAAYRAQSAPDLPPHWTESAERGQRSLVIDLTMETWGQVISDLSPLGYDDIEQLTAEKTHWPWICPFQERQLNEIAERCTDRDALALLEQRVLNQDQKGHQMIAEALSRGLSVQDTTGRSWQEQVIDALVDPVSNDLALDVLRTQIHNGLRSGPCQASDHPLMTLLAQISRRPKQDQAKLRERGWQCLRGIVGQDDSFLHWAERPNGEPVLPLFQLAISLQTEGAGQAGQLAQWLMTLPISSSLRRDQRWWLALFANVLDQTDPGFTKPDPLAEAHLYGSEQTRNAAFGLIYAQRSDLPEEELDKFDAAWNELNITGIWSPDGAIDQ